MKNYEIVISQKSSNTSLSLISLIKFEEEITHLTEYRQKVDSICYSIIIIRSDIAKTVSK